MLTLVTLLEIPPHPISPGLPPSLDLFPFWKKENNGNCCFSNASFLHIPINTHFAHYVHLACWCYCIRRQMCATGAWSEIQRPHECTFILYVKLGKVWLGGIGSCIWLSGTHTPRAKLVMIMYYQHILQKQCALCILKGWSAHIHNSEQPGSIYQTTLRWQI